jgi:adenylate cyclase
MFCGRIRLSKLWVTATLERDTMECAQTDRRTCAILAADVVGYVRLMSEDERGTHARLMRLRNEQLDPRIASHGGTLIKNTGDGFLAIFDGTRAAMDCALAMQRAIAAAEADAAPNQRISMRMGMSFGEVIIEGGDIYGDAVNTAARLQTYAEPGGIAITAEVASRAGDDLSTEVTDLGDFYLHNMAHPVRMFTLRTEGTQARLVGDVPPGSDDRSSIAVLPFRKNQTDPEEAYFADGVVDDIIYALAGLKELFVISRTSARGYQGDTIDARAIGRELGVRYVLYGSVRRAGGRLRIATELSDTETGAVIRSDRYEGDLADLFALQDRISASVVNAIAPQVQERELLRALRKHPQNMTAYDFLLQALDQLYRLDDESVARARGLLQQAMTHDPFFGPAYSYAAFWYVLHVGEGRSTNLEADAAEAARLAGTAIRLNENDPLALAIYGHVQSFLLRDYDRAMLFLDRAIEAGPSSATAWSMSSATCGYIGNGALAVERARRSIRLAPQDAFRFWHEAILGQAHYVDGNYEEAVIWAQRAVGRNGAVVFALRTLTASLMALGKVEEARAAAQQLMHVQPRFAMARYEKRCPLKGEILTTWLERLRAAGLPE